MNDPWNILNVCIGFAALIVDTVLFSIARSKGKSIRIFYVNYLLNCSKFMFFLTRLLLVAVNVSFLLTQWGGYFGSKLYFAITCMIIAMSYGAYEAIKRPI